MTGTLPASTSGRNGFAAGFNEGDNRGSLLVLRVGDDDLAGVDVRAVQAAFFKGVGDHRAGKPLAIADDQVGDAGGELEDGCEPAKDFVERVELMVDERFEWWPVKLEERRCGVFVAARGAS